MNEFEFEKTWDASTDSWVEAIKSDPWISDRMKIKLYGTLEEGEIYFEPTGLSADLKEIRSTDLAVICSCLDFHNLNYYVTVSKNQPAIKVTGLKIVSAL